MGTNAVGHHGKAGRHVPQHVVVEQEDDLDQRVAIPISLLISA